MKLAYKTSYGQHIVLSRRNLEGLLDVLDRGERGIEFRKSIPQEDGSWYTVVITVQEDAVHYNEEGKA